jgi:large subunit ribosomal protein L31
MFYDSNLQLFKESSIILCSKMYVSRFFRRVKVIMKPEIHPEYKQITVTCGCGNEFLTGSVLAKDLHIEVCSSCHPFYTGKQRVVDTAGRVDKFRKRYSK